MAVNLGIVPSQKSTSREFRARLVLGNQLTLSESVKAIAESALHFERDFSRSGRLSPSWSKNLVFAAVKQLLKQRLVQAERRLENLCLSRVTTQLRCARPASTASASSRMLVSRHRTPASAY